MSTSNGEAIGGLVDKMVSMARQDTRRNTLDEVSKVIRKLMDAEWEQTCDTDTDTYAAYYRAMVEVNKLWCKGGSE